MRFYVDSFAASSTSVGSSSGNINRYLINRDELPWLSFVDLTGCYLVKEGGTYVDTGTSATTHQFNPTTDNLTSKTGADDIVYVISHELDNTNSTERYYIYTDRPLSEDTAYRVMAPNHTCMYDFFPKELYFNVPTGQYTKKPDENVVYESTKDFFQTDSICSIFT